MILSYSIPRYLPKRNKSICKYLYMNVPSSFSCNNKKLETAQIQVMGQQTVLYPYNVMLVSNTKVWTLNTKMWINLKIICWVKEIKRKKIHIIDFHLNYRGYNWMNSNSELVRGAWDGLRKVGVGVVSKSWKEWLQRSRRNILRVLAVCIMLIWVMFESGSISQYMSKVIKLYTLHMSSWINVKFISKSFFKE